MKIIDNSRQIPKAKQYLTSSNYYDILYGYLQAMSKWDGNPDHPRYVYKKSVNYSRIAQDLDSSRQTVSKRFKSMLQGTAQNQGSSIPPLIRLSDDGKRYELISLAASVTMLIPQSTLEVLVSVLNDNAISTYAYLFNRYWANKCKQFTFSYKEVKNAIGIAANSNGNNYIIKSILFILQKIGLLKYEQEIVYKNGELGYQNRITWMTNEIEDLPQDIENQVADRKRKELYQKMTGKKVC